MKIGTCISLQDMTTIDCQLSALTAERFDNCQLLSWKTDMWTTDNANTLKKLLDAHRVTVSAFWCGWDGPAVWDFYEGPTTLGLLPEEYRAMRIKNLQDGADFAKKLGISDVVTHMGFIPENPNDPAFLPFCDAIRQVAMHLKSNGQRLLFETGQETPVAMLRCFETIGTDNLGVNLDTANLILYGKANPVDALDVFGKYVCNMHAKDGCYPTNGHDLGMETRLGDGKVDFPTLFRKLKALGYDGYVTIEREIDGSQQTEDIRYAKSYLQSIINEVYGV